MANSTRYFRVAYATATSLALIIATPACATHQPTPQLVDAREAYDNARNGTANTYVPDKVYEARVALQRAEQAHDRRPGSVQEEHLGYLAHRKARKAIAVGEARAANAQQREAEKAREEALLAQRNAAQRDLQTAQSALAQKEASLSTAQQAKNEAEKTAAAALASLNELASVKAEQQRVVITLSGEVLFKTDAASLLPIAENRLAKVAEVLKDQGQQGKSILIAGHTDSRGSASYNEQLSQERANAVRNYLLSQGVDGSMISAVGKGESEPIANNDTPEGRANNRRVEIIINNGNNKSASSSTQGTPAK